MERRRVGRSELEISEVGFGCWAIGGHGYGHVDDELSKKAIHKALDLGINFFDTANVYGFGHSETLLSEALGRYRQEVVIATKVGVNWGPEGNIYRDCSPPAILQSLEESLRRLRVDCIPLYQIHWHDGKTRMDDIMDVLRRCRGAGKIKYIGCCNFPIDLIETVGFSNDVVSLQALYNVKRRKNEGTMEKCYYGRQMGVIAYEVLGRGVFCGSYDETSVFGEKDTRAKDPEFSRKELGRNIGISRVLTEVGSRHGKSATQAAIRWVLDKPFLTCALVGAKTPAQVEENAGAIGWSLLKEDLDMLNLPSTGEVAS